MESAQRVEGIVWAVVIRAQKKNRTEVLLQRPGEASWPALARGKVVRLGGAVAGLKFQSSRTKIGRVTAEKQVPYVAVSADWLSARSSAVEPNSGSDPTVPES